jgi:hypothetical protein
MSIEAMKQALEALENTLGFTGSRQIDSVIWQAITSLRQAIADADKQEIDKPSKQKRPQNCGTGFCSCIECVMDEQEIVSYTTGHCKEKAQPNGCQLHNLHCGYPACDRKAVVNPQPKREPL